MCTMPAPIAPNIVGFPRYRRDSTLLSRRSLMLTSPSLVPLVALGKVTPISGVLEGGFYESTFTISICDAVGRLAHRSPFLSATSRVRSLGYTGRVRGSRRSDQHLRF